MTSQQLDRYRSHVIAFTKSQIKSQINVGDKAMLKTYEAIIQDGQVKWLAEQPEFKSARILITVVEDLTSKSSVKGLSKAQVEVKTLLELAGSEPDAKDIPRQRQLRPYALCADEFRVPENFDDPLPDEVLQEFEQPL